jgi:hypothetical protein
MGRRVPGAWTALFRSVHGGNEAELSDLGGVCIASTAEDRIVKSWGPRIGDPVAALFLASSAVEVLSKLADRVERCWGLVLMTLVLVF